MQHNMIGACVLCDLQVQHATPVKVIYIFHEPSEENTADVYVTSSIEMTQRTTLQHNAEHHTSTLAKFLFTRKISKQQGTTLEHNAEHEPLLLNLYLQENITT